MMSDIHNQDQDHDNIMGVSYDDIFAKFGVFPLHYIADVGSRKSVR